MAKKSSQRGRVSIPAYPQVEYWDDRKNVTCRWCEEVVELPKEFRVAVRKGKEAKKFKHHCGNVIKLLPE